MNNPMIRALKAAISLLGLLGFLIVYFYLFSKDWSVSDPPTENLLELASMLTGVVSGIVATTFGVKVGAPSSDIEARLISAGDHLAPLNNLSDRIKKWLAFGYVVGYFIMVFWAIVIWIGPPDSDRPELINTLAVAGIGILGAIMTSYMGDPVARELQKNTN